MKYWITTDTHFGHQKMVDVWHVRPDGFEDLIWKGLEVVGPDDILIHLGDIQLGRYGKIDFSKYGRTRVLVRGNHDKATDAKYFNMGFDLVVDSFSLRRFGVHWLFTHRPIDSGNEGYDYNIHGHTHGSAKEDYAEAGFYTDKYIELALENNEYKPWTLEGVQKNLTQ